MTRMSSRPAALRACDVIRLVRQWRTLLLLLGLCTHPALAQLNPAFASVVKDPRQQRLVTDAAKQSTVILEHPCPEAKYAILDTFEIVAPLGFDKSTGALDSGSWREIIRYSGCGVSKFLNVLVTADGHRMSARPLLPGTTLAGPHLQLDVFRSPALQSRIGRWRDADCTMAYVADTAFIERESATHPGEAAPPWREVWTLAACDRTDSVTITFARDATGTSFQFLAVPGDAADRP